MSGRQYAVIGLGEFGRAVALTLMEMAGEVMVIDKNPHLIEEIKDLVTTAICTDVTDERTLKETGVGDIDVAVVGVGEDLEAAIIVTVILKKLGVEEVIVKANSGLHSEILKVVGATRTIDPEEEMGKRLAMEIWATDVHARIRLSTGQEVLEVEAPKVFWNKTIAQMNFRARYRLNIIAIKRRVAQTNKTGEVEEHWETNKLPKPDDMISKGDVIIAVGDEKNVKNFLELL